MTILDLSAMFQTTRPVDAALIYKAMYAASNDGVLYLEGIPYDDGIERTYQCTMKQNWGMEDDAVVYERITDDIIDENAPFAEECFTRRARIAKLTEIDAPKFVIENERFFFSVAKILNCYAEKVL